MNSRYVASITDRPLNLPWRGRLARSLFLVVGLTLPATAQLDTQGSGMSDVWQRHFNRDNPALTTMVSHCKWKVRIRFW